MPQPLEERAQRDAARRKRSIAIGIALALLVAVFYALTVVKLGPGLFQRPL